MRNCGQRQCPLTKHNLFEEKREPKRNRAEALTPNLLTRHLWDFSDDWPRPSRHAHVQLTLMQMTAAYIWHLINRPLTDILLPQLGERGWLSGRAPPDGIIIETEWVSGLSPRGTERRENFFSRVNLLCWLPFRYPLHPRVTAVARKKSRSFCKRSRRRLQLKTQWPCVYDFAWNYTVNSCTVIWHGTQKVHRNCSSATDGVTSHLTTK